MQVFGEQEVEIANLVCSDGFEARLQTADVREKAASIGQVGLIHPPLVRASDGRVGPGEDRIAACCLLGWSTITVRLIECSDEELEALREHENRVRRKESGAELAALVDEAARAPDDGELFAMRALGLELDQGYHGADALPLESTPVEPAEAMRALVDAHAGVVEADDTGDPPQDKGGRPRGKRGKAIAKVAEQTGRSAEAVRKAVERAAKKQEAVTIETWGREQPAAWMEAVMEKREELTFVSDKLKAATSALTRLAIHMGIDLLDRREEIRALRRVMRDARPACVCAWCKNLAELVEACTACKGLGWIPESLAAQIPEKLKDPRAVIVRGELRELEDDSAHAAEYAGVPTDGFDPNDAGHEIPDPEIPLEDDWARTDDYDSAGPALSDEEDIGL